MKKLLSLLMLSLVSISSLQGAEVAPPAPVTPPPATAEQTKPQISLRYENKEKHYALEYPATWQKREAARLDLSITPPNKLPAGEEPSDPEASVNILSENMGETVPLERFSSESIANLKTGLKDVQVLKTGDQSLHGTPAKWVLYTHEMQGLKLEVLQYFAVANDQAFIFTFAAPAKTFESFRGDFEKIAASFELTKK